MYRKLTLVDWAKPVLELAPQAGVHLPSNVDWQNKKKGK
jgi:hypothetical protein